MVARLSKREILVQALDRSGCNRLFGMMPPWNGLLVFNYHRVGDWHGSLLDWDLWSASEEQFDQQVRFLAENFDVIGVDDLPQVWRTTRGRYALITFDDGYRDNYELAFPTLKHHGVPATFFLATGFLDRPHVAWWDEIAWMVRTSTRSGLPIGPHNEFAILFDEPNRALAIHQLLSLYKQLPGDATEQFLEWIAAETASGRCPNQTADDLWMTWDMAREMREAGMNFGGHTVNHPILSRLSRENQFYEIGESLLRIEQELATSITSFSYPVGQHDSFNADSRFCLSEHGVDWAFTYYGGYGKLSGVDRFAIPRVAVETETSAGAFRSLAMLPQLFA